MAAVDLNDLLLSLSQLGPGDRAELEGMREALLQAAREPQAEDAVRSLAAEALVKLDELLYGDPVADGKQMLREVVGLVEQAASRVAPAESAGSSSSPEPDLQAGGSGLNLDDLLARMMQLEPQDLGGLEAVRDELMSLARHDGIPDTVRNLSAEALLKLDQLVFGGKSDPAILDEVCSMIGKAIEALDQPAVEPAPTGRKPAAGSAPPVAVAGTGSKAKAGKVSSTAFATALPDDVDADLMEDFVTESLELIEAAEASLLALEVEPEDMEAVNTVFRAFHTVKGTSGFLGLSSLKELAHLAEGLLSRIRDGEILYAGAYADLALRAIDMLKELVLQVQRALGGQPMEKPAVYDCLLFNLSHPEEMAATVAAVPPNTAPRLGDLLVSQGSVQREVIEEVIRERPGEKLGESIVKAGVASTADVAKGLRTQRAMAEAESLAENSVRVRTDRLDRLIDMVGELVIAQAMVSQDSTLQDGRHQELVRKTAQAGKIVRELQDLSMTLRMVPLKPAFQKMNRLVRDLAAKAGKKVRLQTFGEDTEIDRNMVDILRDPLVHMVRNAVDHGIEPAADRSQMGKPEEGLVTLSACHSGGSVVVELADDGRGLNRQKIIDKAIAQGLIESAAGMSDQEVFGLIFRAGFSTADQITEVSGRGVGMDVVRRNIEAIRGRVEINSEYGHGSRFKIVLPLTMAITDGMLVKAGQEKYIIPTVSIVKSFQPESKQLSTIAGKGEMVMLRGELLPLFRLHRLLEIDGAEQDPTEALLVIVAAGEVRYGLMVDELLGQQQVVAKSLGKGIGKVLGISGAAILGDGRVGLILDASEILQLARQEGMAMVGDSESVESF